MSRNSQPVFSLVLATYGRADVLEPLIRSLLAQTLRVETLRVETLRVETLRVETLPVQTLPVQIGDNGASWPSFEVVVADQNPDDRVLPLIEPLRSAGCLGAHLRLSEPNLSKARNAGIAAARGQFVAFPDDDCWYVPDTLARAAAQFSTNSGLDGIAARWAEAKVEPGDEQPFVTRDAMRRFRGGNVASITLFLRLAAVRAVGGFDERIGIGRWYGSGEETDLVFRLLERGCAIAHAPDVEVHHAIAAPQIALSPGVAFAQERHRGRGTGAMYAKHHLPAWVALRGLLAPLAVLPGADFAAGAGRTVGRLEGMIRWQFEERLSRGHTSTSISDKDH